MLAFLMNSRKDLYKTFEFLLEILKFPIVKVCGTGIKYSCKASVFTGSATKNFERLLLNRIDEIETNLKVDLTGESQHKEELKHSLTSNFYSILYYIREVIKALLTL